MGQRHQFYCVYNNKEGKKQVVGLHHQWCYGRLPLMAVFRILTYNKNASEYDTIQHSYTLKDAYDKLSRCVGFDYTTGYNSMPCDITGETTDNPARGDNNDGITIIDLRNPKKPAYCHMFLYEHDEKSSTIQPMIVLSASEYWNHYKEGYKQYYPNLVKGVNKYVKYFEKKKVLTLQEVKELFPLMFAS